MVTRLGQTPAGIRHVLAGGLPSSLESGENAFLFGRRGLGTRGPAPAASVVPSESTLRRIISSIALCRSIAAARGNLYGGGNPQH
jgi:hypothetical protein